jgi:hypothetical protein
MVAQQPTEKLSYEQLKNVASQMKEEAEVWKRRAYEEAGKISRINLLLECLKLQCEYIEFKEKCFTEDAVQLMSNELINILYPKETKSDNNDLPETEPVDDYSVENVPQTC